MVVCRRNRRQVGTPCLSIANPLDPHPERESLDPLGVIAVLGDVPRNHGSGSTIPEPRISIQPEPLAQRASATPSGITPPLQLKHDTSTSTDGSVNGKKCGRRPDLAVGAEDRARPPNASQRPLQIGEAFTSVSTASPSIWWNWGRCWVASESGRGRTRPGTMM